MASPPHRAGRCQRTPNASENGNKINGGLNLTTPDFTVIKRHSMPQKVVQPASDKGRNRGRNCEAFAWGNEFGHCTD